jgi:hypothetical protein
MNENQSTDFKVELKIFSRAEECVINVEVALHILTQDLIKNIINLILPYPEEH